ncbi:MAG TPA: hypothetical protein VGG75_15920 [Trebonia sp.]|jgi:hypothetical protein
MINTAATEITWYTPPVITGFTIDQDVLLSDILVGDWNAGGVGGFPAGRVVAIIHERYLGYCRTCEHEYYEKRGDGECPGPWYNVDFGEFGIQRFAGHELQAAIAPPAGPDEQLELFDVFAWLLPPEVSR